MSTSYCSQKRRRTQKASEQGDSAKEYSRKKARQADDMSLCDRYARKYIRSMQYCSQMSLRSIFTSTSRPQSKKLLFALPHSGCNTEEPAQPTASQVRSKS